MDAAHISATINKALLSIGNVDGSAKNALGSAAQLAAGIKDLKQGDFFQIYQNVLLSESMSKLWDDSDEDHQGQDGFSGLGGDFQSLLSGIPGLNAPQNLEISHVVIEGNKGKVVFSDGSSKDVPIQAAKP